MKTALITDIHYGARGGSIYFQEAMDTFINKQVLPTLKKLNIKTLFVLGDFTDSRKSTNYKIIQQVRKNFFNQLADLNIDVFMICGNHDIFYKEKNDIASFDVLFGHYDNVTPVLEPMEVDNILLLPWINKNNEDKVKAAIRKTDCRWCFGHFEIEGAKMYKNSRAEHGMDADVLKKFDCVFSGHFHHRSQYGNIQYIGAAGYYTWQDYGDYRGFMLFDTETGKQKPIENEYCLFKRIGYDDSDDDIDYRNIDLSELKGKYVELVVENKSDEVLYRDFVGLLYESGAIDIKITDKTVIEKEVDEEGNEVDLETKEVIQLVYEYIGDNITNSDEITDTVKDIHHEAISVQ